MRVGRKQHIYLVYNFEKAQITFSKIFSSSDLLMSNVNVFEDVIAKSFGYITGLNNDSFNKINVLKTGVARSQRNGKDNAKFNYCRCIACRRLKEGSIVNNLELEK